VVTMEEILSRIGRPGFATLAGLPHPPACAGTFSRREKEG